MGQAGLDHGTYEVLRARLAGQAAELARRAEALNARRLEVFGGTELRLVGTERIRTEHNCVPRDIVSAGRGLMLFGYNVFIGLKPETAVDDVFSLHRFVVDDGAGVGFEKAMADTLPDLLRDPAFERDFAELYRYYRQARLLQLRRLDGRLLAVFQTGPRLDDIRVLRWSASADGDFGYIDNRGERDHVFASSHDFEWTETTRDDHVLGRHPHISIEGEVFVETVGGTLTVKVEDNTESGHGIYSEPVDEPLQSLADADVHHARIGAMILLRIRPYNEVAWRHLVFNTRTKAVVRLDGIEQACRRLPEDQGIIFPGGYYLDTGVAKTFDTDVTGLEYERAVRSPNGEDVLYVFHSRDDGRSLLLHYNVIRKQVATPIVCHGYSLFEDGTLVVLRAFSDEPARVHPVQVWQTPYVSDAHAAAQPVGAGPLERVGNADLVRGISDCLSVARMVEEMSPSAEVFEALIASCVRAADFYHWLGEEELGDLLAPLGDVRSTARQVLEEYENVQALMGRAAEAVDQAAGQVGSLIRATDGQGPDSADAWVTRLAELRRAQGHLETLRDVRYVDVGRIDELAAALADEQDDAGRRTVAFLQTDGAFTGYHQEIERLTAESGAIATAAEAAPVGERLTAQTEGLEIVTEVVGSLDIADATIRTAILERVGEVLGGLNRARAVLDSRRRELLDVEGRAAFAAEFALLDQAIAGALAMAGTPDRCDEQLGRLLLRLETLESRFADFDDFVARLEAKRTDAYEAFSSRKQALLDERARRADRLNESAARILAGVHRRTAALASLEEVNTYFATDAMVARLRGVADELRALGETVRAEELEGRLKSARQEAGRSLRDRLDLYADGGSAIRLGRHRFAVNTQPTELTLVPQDGAMAFAVTGTDYRAAVRDEAFSATREFWDQPLVSETSEIYRAEYLAASILLDAEKAATLADLHEAARTDGGLLEYVRHVAGSRYDEGYERGVHDHDAALILAALLRLHTGAGLLRFPPAARAAAQLFWAYGTDEPARTTWTTRAVSLSRARAAFGRTVAVDDLCAELSRAIATFVDDMGTTGDTALAGEYLFEELATAKGFVTSARARKLLRDFRAALGTRSDAFDRDLQALSGSPAARHQLAEAWLASFVSTKPGTDDDLPEAIALLLAAALPRYDASAELTATVDGLVGAHPRLTGRTLVLRLDELLTRAGRFHKERVPAFRAYQRHRTELITAEQKRLRLEEHRPKVMSAFVRNRLLDEVYLPLIGDNLAKQLGAAGDAKRTDQMGLLLLISPPGYGKTTLMEYVAERLGLLLVKVNGPALGHAVTSLDPAEAPNATARQEVEKINFALELGNNVLLYLDDIQHTSSELLQKFIPLCDAQRRIEGVRDGSTRTYDLRGKRFAVCMAGNPYTESGTRFQIPDMLANRADVWNLGDVLSGRDELFALSHVENALTSNPVLAPLSTRDRGDLELLVRLADGDQTVRPDRLSHPYSQVELDQILSVLRKLLRVQQTVLAVNQAYMASAAQSDASRTEPPFKLQGSYRNMNKLAERIIPVMNDDELEAIIDDHYQGEAQTLTTGAESNLLKLAELRGRLTPAQSERWTEVKTAYLRAQALGGDADDPVGRAVGAIGLLADRMASIETAIDRASRPPAPGSAGRHAIPPMTTDNHRHRIE
ncbi:AAA family ATPase [Actinomadura rudentiformis]|uniref:AAA family ATPase n=1 Tax=Actinomadura rudentiformis TaxID=359158 RepID=A0A6H9ZDZ9_9ACTN|nr:DNA repair ATPase [Actinomadura rudentiformis]KAB2352739.1 AAA family ATPase [Actinomadura rudentiformis]